jgi:hypothetical protein
MTLQEPRHEYCPTSRAADPVIKSVTRHPTEAIIPALTPVESWDLIDRPPKDERLS